MDLWETLDASPQGMALVKVALSIISAQKQAQQREPHSLYH